VIIRILAVIAFTLNSVIAATNSLPAVNFSVTAPNHPALPIEHHLTLPPGPGNARNSEGDFVRLKDGRWLFVYTHFTAGAADHASAFLASRESSDGGRTWSEKDNVVVPNEGGFNVMSVSLLRLKSGDIALFYLRKNSLEDCRPVMRFSRDEGKTWSEPINCITDQVGYYILNNSRVIQLKNGRLVLPTALHQFRNKALHPGEIVTYLSDDQGKTWRRSKTVLATDAAGTRINFMEPGVVEVKKKHLLMTIRTKLGCQYFSESTDNGETWSTARPSDVLSPESPATLVKIPSTGDLLLIWNDHCDQPENYRISRPPIRTPLSAAISRDGGKSWEKTKLIEDKPDHGYCYTAVAFERDRALLGYCAHASRWGLETLQISSFKVTDLYR
jgi:sialidase-1